MSCQIPTVIVTSGDLIGSFLLPLSVTSPSVERETSAEYLLARTREATSHLFKTSFDITKEYFNNIKAY